MELQLQFLPHELLAAVFTYCGWKNRRILRCVCKSFNNAIEVLESTKTPFEPYLNA